MEFQELSGPAAVVDKRRAMENMQRMQERATLSGALFRPHFKTHQSLLIGEWCREIGIKAITVSSPAMAEYFAMNGWNDILIALPMQPGATDSYNRLAHGRNIELITDSIDAVQTVGAELAHPLGLWIEIDAGYHRTGVGHWDQHRVIELACAIDDSSAFELRGILTHAGSSYQCRSVQAVQALFDEQMARLSAVKNGLVDAGFEGVQISFGDTPCCSMAESLMGIDELRPGNLIFYDLMQEDIGSCREEDIALAVACPVLGVYPERNEVVIHGGAVHFSKEQHRYESGLKIFGKIVSWGDGGWSTSVPGVYLRAISQEHGIIEGPDEWVREKRPGDVLLVLPVHACLTMNLLGPDFIELNESDEDGGY